MTFVVSPVRPIGASVRRGFGRSLRVLWCVAALWSWGCCLSVTAGEQPLLKLDGIVVEATRLAAGTGFSWLPVRPAGETPKTSLHDLLNELPGIHLVRRGGGFAETQDEAVVVRGLDARRFVLALNDHPVGMSGVMGGSRIDWDLLAPGMGRSVFLERTPRGAAPHGSVGGVVRLETACPAKREGSVLWEAGPFGLQWREFAWGDREGGLAWRVDLADSRSDGYLRNQNRDLKRVAGRVFWVDPAGARRSGTRTDAARGNARLRRGQPAGPARV